VSLNIRKRKHGLLYDNNWKTFPSCNKAFVTTKEIPAQPRTQYDCHHDTKVKSEAATAVIELLIMGGKSPETC